MSLALLILVSSAAPDLVPVGAARLDVTPTHPVLLAGYGSRTSEHDGADTRLWARALAIGGDEPVLLIVVDNAGFPAAFAAEVERRVEQRSGVPPERLVVCATHTHCAPTLTGYAPLIWRGRATAEQEQRVERYTRRLADELVEVAARALAARRPARLAWAQGQVGFGGNRRVVADGVWSGFGFQRDGPVDHSLPLLVARDREGAPTAVWTGYACHCTTLGSRNRLCGDWAGFANERIEADHPGAVALCTIGCGADVGPQPSGGLPDARRHGAAIADEVARLLAGELTSLGAPPSVRARRVTLPLAEAPPREHWLERAARSGFDGEHARLMLEVLARDGALPTGVEVPLTTWTFGRDLAIAFLAGEVVVDYAVRLKTELDWTRLWLNGWCDAVPGYIPSRRVLAEGGYEAEFSQTYYGQPARFDPGVEDLLVGALRELLGEEFVADEDAAPAPFLRYPSARSLFLRGLPGWIAARTPAERTALDRLASLAPRSREGFGRVVSNDGEQGQWFDYTGTPRPRPFVRQLRTGDALRWETASSDGRVFVFLGGLGWESEPEVGGFELLVGERGVLTFDVTRAPATWEAPDGSARLHYLPTWTSDLDSGGIFHLELRRGADGPLTLAVRSRGEGSRRWFAVDTIPDVKVVEQALVEAARR